MAVRSRNSLLKSYPILPPENEPDTKLAYEADPESGAIHIVEADYRFDLTDIPAPFLDTLRKCGVCMGDLEDKLVQEDVVYGTTETENS